MSASSVSERNGVGVKTLEMLLHALSHEVESQAYLQLAIRETDDPELKALLIEILGQEQLHETRLRSRLRELYALEV